METLPNEMLELIVRRLEPQDIARCSAVCRSWYEAMNQDWIWEPFCDPELEEPLRTIPSVATPKFEISETKTLSSICRWKLAIFREKHLWKNWRSEKIMNVKNSPIEPAFLKVHNLKKKWGPEKTILNFGNNDPLCIDFFSDTQIVAWNNKKIEILDVSITPAVVVAKTETLVEIERYYQLCVVKPDLLFVGKCSSIEVYKVDISKKSITLHLNLGGISFYKHPIGLVKNNLFLFISYKRENLKVLDLNNGTILKEEPCPRKANENEKTCVSSIFVSPTSDFVVVTFHLTFTNNRHIYNKVYVYCLKELKFLPGPQIDICGKEDHAVSLHERWLAILGSGKVSILNVTESGQVLCSDEIILNSLFTTKIDVCNGRFVFLDVTEQIDNWWSPTGFVKSHKSLLARKQKFDHHQKRL